MGIIYAINFMAKQWYAKAVREPCGRLTVIKMTLFNLHLYKHRVHLSTMSFPSSNRHLVHSRLQMNYLGLVRLGQVHLQPLGYLYFSSEPAHLVIQMKMLRLHYLC